MIWIFFCPKNKASHVSNVLKKLRHFLTGEIRRFADRGIL